MKLKKIIIRDLIRLLILENFFSRKNILENSGQEEQLNSKKSKAKKIDNENSDNDTLTIDFPDNDSFPDDSYSIKPIKPIPNPAYYFAFQGYTENLIKQRQDFTNNVPSKNLKWHPTSMMGGVLGYTYLGAGTINKRDDLVFRPTLSYEVDVHESIHTEWEYETRVLTAWMLSYDPNFGKY